MSFLEALLLGILQGLTEFLPISSSGHVELGKALLNVQVKDDITFTVVVHGATVLSTIVVFYRDIAAIFSGLFKIQWNEAAIYAAKIAVSMVPVVIVGLLFKEDLEALFSNNITLVGWMLLITATLLAFTFYAKKSDRDISYSNAFVIGVVQAIAVLPGISRSGATIAIALMLGVKKEAAVKFSFLMVLIPIIGANVKDLVSGEMADSEIGTMPLLVGFIGAFIAGVAACKLMVSIVKKGKLIYFAIYCAIVGLIAISSLWL